MSTIFGDTNSSQQLAQELMKGINNLVAKIEHEMIPIIHNHLVPRQGQSSSFKI